MGVISVVITRKVLHTLRLVQNISSFRCLLLCAPINVAINIAICHNAAYVAQFLVWRFQASNAIQSLSFVLACID